MDPGATDSEEGPPRMVRGSTGRQIGGDTASSSSDSSLGVRKSKPEPSKPAGRANAPSKRASKAKPSGKGSVANAPSSKGGKSSKSKKGARPEGLPAGPGKAKSKKRKSSSGGGGGGVGGGGGSRKEDAGGGGASSGEEYSADLLANYIGQTGACAALGLAAFDVLNVDAWRALSDEEKHSLRAHLPQGVSEEESDAIAERVLSGEALHFGSPRDRVFEEVVAGLTHPRVKRWRQRVALIERRHHILGLRDYQNRAVRRISALKTPREAADDVLAQLAITGGGISKAGGALLSLPERIEATANAAARSPTNEWDVSRWRRVLNFRNQEAERYQVPERPFVYTNPWGTSIVSPLKRGPALDGGRPREHDLLRNERPSHVTILCIVRDAASRLPGNKGTRAQICDLLRDSQYLREGATFQQLNTVVSGALDRLHYETNAPVRYDQESKEWCYLHNDMGEDDFETPEWALPGGAHALAGVTGGGSSGHGNGRAGAAGSSEHPAPRPKKKKRRR